MTTAVMAHFADPLQNLQSKPTNSLSHNSLIPGRGSNPGRPGYLTVMFNLTCEYSEHFDSDGGKIGLKLIPALQ
jgi:hypothetical protein